MNEGREGPPASVRLIGRSLNALVARAPWTWPLVRAPMRRFFDSAAAGWDKRTGAGSVDHLTPLAVAVAEVVGEPERILDVGTGTGEAALFLAREYPRASVRGVDISKEMIREAQTKVGLEFYDQPPENVMETLWLVDPALNIPPGEAAYESAATGQRVTLS